MSKKTLLYSAITIAAVIALAIGLTYAWFYNRMNMGTLLEIKGPADISILGPDGSEMESIDLNYANAKKDENGKLTIRKVICIQSAAEAHRLEIVHTTNLKGLEFKLYPVVPDSGQTDSGTAAAGTGIAEVTDGGKTYQYRTTAVDGTYINLDSGDGESQDTYKYAGSSKHETNYGKYDKVQTHAEPLYWLSKVLNASPQTQTTDESQAGGNQETQTYYVCEVSWTETTKETDIFYILARTAVKQAN